MKDEYKVNFTGKMPTDWRLCPLDEILDDYQNGYAFSANKYVVKGIPIVSMGNISLTGNFQFDFAKCKYWDEKHKESLRDFIISKGDIIIAMTDVTPTKNLIGRMAEINIEGEFLLNQRVGLLRINTKKAAKKFIHYIGNSDFWIKYCQSSATQGAQANISTKDIKRGLITLPPLPEQQKIAAILNTVDEKIEVIEAQIQQTTELKKGLMQQLLTNGIGHTQFKDSPLGEIPESWSYGKIADFCDVHNNLRKPISAEIRKGMQGHFPYYGPTGIVDYINEYLVDGEYTLIGEDGDHFLKYETWSMTNLVSGKFNVNNHAHLIKGKDDCSTAWVNVFFQHRNIVPFLTRQGAGRYKLTKETLMQLPMLLPSVKEQQRIVEVLSCIDLKRKNLQDKRKIYQTLKKGLMQQLLTGKMRVN